LDWLSVSYNVSSPISVGRTVYMHGTRNISDALNYWPALLADRQVPAQKELEKFVMRNRAQRVVGHSLGASWVLPIAKRHNLAYTGYGRPGLSHQRGDVANLGDPVAFFQFHPTRLAFGHSLSSYG